MQQISGVVKMANMLVVVDEVVRKKKRPNYGNRNKLPYNDLENVYLYVCCIKSTLFFPSLHLCSQLKHV